MYCAAKLFISFLHAGFEEELSKSVLSFDINETVDALISFNNSLNGGATGQQSGGARQSEMSDAIDELVMNLRSLEAEIVNIGNQVVSVWRHGCWQYETDVCIVVLTLTLT